MQKLRNWTYHKLRWSERFTKTDMVYLAKGNFWLTTGKIISSISVFLLAIAFANLLARDTYGTYKYVLSITGILSVFTLRGMDTAVLHAVARGFEGVFISALKAKVKWGLLSAVSSLGISIYYYINGNLTLSLSFLIASGFLPLMDSFGIYHSLLHGKRLFRASSIYGTLSQVISALILIATIFYTQNVFFIIFVYFASWTILRFFFLWITVKKTSLNQNYDPETIPYGKRMSFINILDAFISSVDGLLIFHYLGAVNLAIYSFAIAPISQVKGLVSNIPTLAMPKLSNRPTLDIEELLKKRILSLFVVGIIASGLYILAAPYIYQMFFPKYLDAVIFSQLFSLTLAIYLPQTIFGAVITSKLTLIPPRMLYLWNVPGLLFILLALLSVLKFGIIGIIFSRLVSLISGFFINLIVWKKIRGIEG